MAYDHHKKAGNQGDCVKHPALMAAIDTVLALEAPRPFHYLDLFAGHAWHPLLDLAGEKPFEWKSGIGQVHETLWLIDEQLWLLDPKLDSHVRRWRNWYLPRRSSLVRGWYPGSALIAADMCRARNRPIRMTLFDICDDVQASLRHFFTPGCPTGVTEDDSCVIGRSLMPTEASRDLIQGADFVFIDPPGWRSTERPSYPWWDDFVLNVLMPRQGNESRPTLLWMPAGGQEDAYPWNENSNGPLRQKCDRVEEIGYSWTAVRWQHNSYSACILAYNTARAEIRSAVECICNITAPNWESRHSQIDGPGAPR